MDAFEDDEPIGEPLTGEAERFFLCPCCGAKVSVLLDLSVEHQKLTEDCEVCCRPLEIEYAVEEGEVTEFAVTSGQE
jgi:transcription elongation factor Elf1